jgi:hypothetical protein
MAKNLIDVGINLNDGTGDNLRTAGTKINNMFTEVYSVFGDGTNLSNTAQNLHIVNDVSPQLGGNLDLNGYGITGNGSINIIAQIQSANNIVAGGALQGATAAISGTSTFGGAVTLSSTLTGTVGSFTTSMTTGTLNATTELQVTGPASITGAITSGAVGSKLRFYYANVAAFPSATTYEGGLAFAEDTNRMYMASDTAWVSLAPEASPALTGVPTAPTAAKATDTTQIATTEHVKDVVADYAPLASPALTGNPTAPTAATADNDTSIATTAHVWANRNALQANIDLKAPLASPALTGTPTTTTQATGTRASDGASTQISNSQYVRNVATEIYNAVDLKAPLASPNLSGTPTTPTAAANVNNTQIASTGYVTTGIGNAVATINDALALRAPIASPAFTGTPTAPTASVGSSDTTIATTSYVGARIDAKFDDASYLTNKLTAYALKASPALTGIPTAPTAADGTNTTQIATTAFIKSAIDTRFSTENLSLYAKINSQVFTGAPTVPTPSDNNDTLQIANTAFVQNWTTTYGNVPKWGGARKYVSTASPSVNDGVNGDIWFQVES